MDRRLIRAWIVLVVTGTAIGFLLALSVHTYDPPRYARADDGADLKTDLVAWWDLEEESGVRYDAHGSNDLTDNNTVLYAAGVISNAADFTAANTEYLSIADNSDLSSGDVDMTLACWVNADSLASNPSIFGKWVGPAKKEYYLRYTTDAGLNRYDWYWSTDCLATANVAANTLGLPSTGTWYYLIAWHDSVSDTISIMVNDGAADSTAAAGGCDQDHSFQMAALDGLANWDGQIDICAVWKRTLTAAEKTWLYNSGNGRQYSDIGIDATPTPTPTATSTATATATATVTPTATTTPTVMVGSVYTMSLPSGGTGTVTASADFGSLLIVGAVVGVGIVVLAWVSYQKARLMSKKL